MRDSYHLPKEYYENLLDEIPINLPPGFREEFINTTMKNSPGGPRTHISFHSFLNITNMTININNLVPIVRRINLYFDKEYRDSIDLKKEFFSYNIDSNSDKHFREDDEDYDILFNSDSSINALKKIFKTTHSPITVHSNPYFDGRIAIYNSIYMKLDRYDRSQMTGKYSQIYKELQENIYDKSYDNRMAIKTKKFVKYSEFEYTRYEEYFSKTHEYQKKLSTFVNQMTWFQYSALLEFKRISDKNQKNHRSGDTYNTQLKFPLSCLPLFIFMLISPTSISEIVKLGRNDISQRNITTYFKPEFIRSLVSSVKNMDGDKLLNYRQAIVDMYSHFSKIIISAILSSPELIFDTPKNKAGDLEQIKINTTNVKFDDFFWLNMDIFTNIANIGSEANVPLFEIDSGFWKWYSNPEIHINLNKDVLNKQFNPYKDPKLDEEYKFLKDNPYLNWEAESFLLKNNYIIPYYSQPNKKK